MESPKNKKLQLRSRPEANPAPYFIDTGKFRGQRHENDRAGNLFPAWLPPGGFRVLLSKGECPDSGNPFFHGGDISVAWLPTGEIRSYNPKGGYFNGISPNRPVFDGGPGAWELVARFSYTDLDSGSLRGGKFWRFTPMVNWHLSDNIRLEMVYGFGSLDRFNITGKTHFFQTRLQLQL
jgi:phosphate-selective porin OprO/OprP